MMDWIPVGERLPADREDVLVVVASKHGPSMFWTVGRYDKGDWLLDAGLMMEWEHITHWLAVPALPEWKPQEQAAAWNNREAEGQDNGH